MRCLLHIWRPRLAAARRPRRRSGPAWRRRVPGVLALVACAWTAVAAPSAEAAADATPAAAMAGASPAGALRERGTALAQRLQANPFGVPLVVESIETSTLANGDVYAIVPHPYSTVLGALQRSDAWCEVLVLHLNVKHCAARPDRVALRIGTKHAQPIATAQLLELGYVLAAHTPDYLRVDMSAADGPLGTRDYALWFEATSWSPGRTLVHLRYAMGYGFLGRLAMQGYLGTIGAHKIGFSVEPAADGKAARPVGGVRGAVERNAVRYYLAVAAYVDNLALPGAERLSWRLQAWFDATERYPEQLHEIERDEYLAMKREELR